MTQTHEAGIRRALKSAQKAEMLGEVPIGAALELPDGEWIESGNLREEGNDPTGHAEIRVIREAARRLQNWRLPQTTLYVQIEPCLLCSGAIYLSRIPRVVFGASNPKGGALVFSQENRKKLGLNHSVEITSGVLEQECAAILQDFFAEKRKA